MTPSLFPVASDLMQKTQLLKLLENEIKRLDDNNNAEATRQMRSLVNFKEELEKAAAKEAANWKVLLEMVEARHRAKDIPYAILRVSKRKYIVIQRWNVSGGYNLGFYLNQTFSNCESLVQEIDYKPLTSNCDHRQSRVIYGCLVTGKEVPPEYRKFLLSEQEEE